MDRISFVNLSVGRARTLEGLIIAPDSDRTVTPDSRILGAWTLGHATDYGAGGIIPGRDWLAVVWRTPDGLLNSFGRIRDHREYLGLEDDKVFYTASATEGRELVQVYNRVAERLSRKWGVRPYKVLGLEGHQFVRWIRSLPEVILTLS
jgi:hypothetical protein